ncbi:hypothetical protein FHL15_007681 [Xylaria flabelliformis]|uniref:Uncharacterized protein n=1 Tax=Xylaria flabelliformis TaxID=2512241 RepID=A0A553HU55_9PEZI|nr:hypothetical protein FHL15_007681 [Xylaria flabelliformis]
MTIPEALRQATNNVTELVAANPGKAAAVGVGVAMLTAPMVVAAPILGAIGALQAGIGNVVAGSTFAIVQSAAMGGYGTATVAVAAQGVGGATAAGGLWSMINTNPKSEGNDDPTDEKEECSESERTDQKDDDGAKDDNSHEIGGVKL